MQIHTGVHKTTSTTRKRERVGELGRDLLFLVCDPHFHEHELACVMCVLHATLVFFVSERSSLGPVFSAHQRKKMRRRGKRGNLRDSKREEKGEQKNGNVLMGGEKMRNREGRRKGGRERERDRKR